MCNIGVFKGIKIREKKLYNIIIFIFKPMRDKKYIFKKTNTDLYLLLSKYKSMVMDSWRRKQISYLLFDSFFSKLIDI